MSSGAATSVQCICRDAFGRRHPDCRAHVQQDAEANEVPQAVEGVMPDTSELFYAYMEAHRAEAEDAYFEARPGLTRSPEVQRVFRDGFERAYRKLWDQMVRGGVMPK